MGGVEVCATHGGPTTFGQAWGGVEECEADGVEERALSRAGRTGDGEQSGVPEGAVAEVDVEGLAQTRDVLAADG
ncbi:MAG: hypothetical protein ACJAZO_003311 [Myxococcota bacterium]|jgi:hypothetical protein